MRDIKNAIYSGANNKKSLFDLTIPNDWNNTIIIFIHGYMGYKDWGCWDLVEDFFTNKNYGFLKYNVSHNGGTLDNPIDFDDLASFAENNYLKELQDFEAITNIIQADFEDQPEIFIIGHSRGGGISLLQSDNGFVSKIVSWAGICSIADRFPKGDALVEWKNHGFYYRENGRTKQTMPHSYSQYESFLKFEQRLNIEKYCKNSTTPTLIIHGDKDVSVNISEGEKIANWLGTQLVRIEGAQHTFGSSQPWESNALPKHLLQVCEATLDFFENSDAKIASKKEEKLSLMSDLVKLAKSDKSIREIEFQFLISLSAQMGITKEDFKRLFDEFIEFHPPKLEADRIIQFQRLILLMNVDLNTDKAELNHIKDIGIRMGLLPSATDEVLRRMHEYENKMVPTDVLLSIFKTFHN